MSYKNLKLTMSDCKTILGDIATEMHGKLSVADNGKGLTQFSIEIPGQGVALLNIHDTAKGLTINPQVGKLQGISEVIAKRIAESSQTVTTKTHTYKSITGDIYNEFKEFTNEFVVEPHTLDDNKEILKISTGRPEVTVTWFKTNHTLMIQGRTTPLWDEVVLWFADKTCDNPKDIIEIVFDAYEKFGETKIKYDDNFLESLLRKKIDVVYGNSKILRDYEIKWLKTSLFLLELDLDLPEYYPCISSAIKVVEGVLRRICLSKFGLSSFNRRNFAQFEEAPAGGGSVRLKDIYKATLKDPASIDYIESLYNFMRSKRHPYTHNSGIAPAELTNKTAAGEIFDEVITLINESNNFTKVLF